MRYYNYLIKIESNQMYQDQQRREMGAGTVFNYYSKIGTGLVVTSTLVLF